MTNASTSSTITIVGTGFYPSGSATLTFTTNAGTATTYTMVASAAGAVSDAISASSINGIGTATSLSLYATDITTGDRSNTVQIQLTNIVVNPVLTQPTGSITVVTY